MKQQDLLNTVILLCILGGGLFTFWTAAGNIHLQLIIGGITTAAYVTWGIVHHILSGDFHRKVVIEYVLVGLIALVLLATLAV